MGLFDQLTQFAGSFLGNNQQSTLLKAVTEMLGQQTGSGGGFASLVQNFQKNGLGDILSSWIGTGQNMPVSSEQIQQGLGGDLMQQLAAKTGLPVNQLSSHLTDILPNLIDKMTPNGQMPEGGSLTEVLTLIQSKLK
ncbi:MAG: YidB family protein [bacterium]